MLSNEEHFAPFVSEARGVDGQLSSAAYRCRCECVLRSGEWGGQLEVQALADSLQVPITVHSADAPPLLVGERFDGHPMHLAFHRFYCALGEHYNSCVPAK
jgi:OTU domain-containing protein 6